MTGQPLPRSPADVTLHRLDDGATLERRGRYFSLSARGLFIWERLDGSSSLPELVRAWLDTSGRLEPAAIVQTLERLREASFLGPAAPPAPEPNRWTQPTWRLQGVDPSLRRLYVSAGHRLVRGPGLWALVALALVGGLGFAWGLGHQAISLQAVGLWDGVWLYVAFFPCVIAHELAHAMALYGIGGRVQTAGFGLLWGLPTAFVDTSAVWTRPRRERIAVSLAGPFANVVIAGGLSLLALGTDGLFSHRLWLLAAANYAAAVLNLLPFVELDGYHVVSDALGRPHLLRESYQALVRGGAWRLRLFAVASVLTALALPLMGAVVTTGVRRWLALGLTALAAAELARRLYRACTPNIATP